MIYPRLDKVSNGQRMSVGLVNGLIKRTEYAADLLRQYKLVAGINIDIQGLYDGTTVVSTRITIPTTDEYGFDFIRPNVQYTFPSFTAPPGELLGPGLNISRATSGRLVISGGQWEHGVFAPDNGFVGSYSPTGSEVNLPIPYGPLFVVGWISCGYGPSFPFTGGSMRWETD